MKVIYYENKRIRVEIEKISDRPYFSMQYYGDDCFGKYLQVGSESIEEFCSFVEKNLIIGKKVKDDGKEHGCSAFTAHNPEGDILFARNMDCECSIPMRIQIHNNDEYRSLSFADMVELEWEDNTYDTLESDAKLTMAASYSPKDGITNTD